MGIGLIGTKIGMTREFMESGQSVPVTVIKIEKGRVLDVINKEKRGYNAVKVGFFKLKNSKLTKQMKGYFAKKNTEPKKILKEFRVENSDQYKEGNELGLEIFKDKKYLDVKSKTIGKGFAGVMKRWNFGGLRASHGVSVSHRSHGSTGQRQDPGKVFKGKKMAGHMGDKLRTMLNLEVIKSDLDNNLLYIKGSIPGSRNSTVLLRASIKKVTRKTIKEKYEAKIKAAAAKKGKKYMKFPLLNIDGSKTESIEISDKLVKLKVNHKLIKFVIDWQSNHAKPRKAKTKQRNSIKGSTKKIVPQKGGGGARHASKKAPLFVGGGVAHGPKGSVYKIKKINKKVRKLALAQTLSKKNFDKNLHILADVKKEIKKTKHFNSFLQKNKLVNALIITDTDTMKNIDKSARNIKNIKLIKDEGANVYDLFNYKKVILTYSSAKKIQQRVLNEKN